MIRWRSLNKAAKQKYLDASEEDKKRYKTEVCEMTKKVKPAKNQRKKKLLKNAKNLEKTMDDLIQYSTNLPTTNNQTVEENRSAEKQSKVLKFPYESTFKLSGACSSRKVSYIVNHCYRGFGITFNNRMNGSLKLKTDAIQTI